MGRRIVTSYGWNLSLLKFVIVFVFLVFCTLAGQPVEAATSAALKVTPAAKPAVKTKKKSVGLKKVKAAPKAKPSGKKAKQKNTLSTAGKQNKKANKKKSKKSARSGSVAAKDLNKPIKRFWDFQSPKLKKIPAFWVPVSGQWQIAKEPAHPGNKILRQTSAKRNFQYLLSKEKYSNFEFSARVRADSFAQKTRNWQLGLIFRQANQDYYYKFRITAANLALIRCSPENQEVLPGSQGSTRVASATGRQGNENERMIVILPNAAKPDEWYTLSVSCYGERIIVKLNKREIRMVFDSGMGYGHVGVYSYKTQAFFDDFRLYYLPVPRVDRAPRLNRHTFVPGKDKDVMIYFNNPRAGNAQVRVLDPKQKLFNLLTKEWHGPEINAVAWDGKGLLGEPARPGRYTIEVEAGGTTTQAFIRVKPPSKTPRKPARKKQI